MTALHGPHPRPYVDSLPVYSRATAHGIVWRASSNEAPLPPSLAAVQAANDAMASAHLYPDLEGEALTAAIAHQLALAPDQVAVGPGSLALLERLLLAYTGPGDEVIHAWRSYEAYPILIAIAGASSVAVPLDPHHTHDVDALLQAVTERTRVVIICNPNNPTGTVVAPAELERLITSLPPSVLIVIDEAYLEFDTDAPATLQLMENHPNVVLLRTFSKAYALAGLRAGYLLAAKSIVITLCRVALPFGVNRVAQAAAIAALEDSKHLRAVVQEVEASKTRLTASLSEHLEVPESRANFLWLPVGPEAEQLARTCAANGASVRAFAGEGVRVTVGRREVETIVTDAVRAVVNPRMRRPRAQHQR